MDAIDPRTRHKVPLNAPTLLPKSAGLSRHLIADLMLVSVLHAGKYCLLSPDVGVFWVLVRVLACGGFAAMIWLVISGQLQRSRAVEWSVVGTSSLLLFLRCAGLFTALYRLPSTRVIIITQFSIVWFKCLVTPAPLPRTISILLGLAISFLSDAGFSPQNFRDIFPGYGALAVEALSSSMLEHTEGVLLPSLGRPLTMVFSTLGACIFSLPLYMLRHVLLNSTVSSIPSLQALAVIPFLSYALLYYVPRSSLAINSLTTHARDFVMSYSLTVFASIVVGYIAFGTPVKWTDLLVASLLLYGMYPRMSDPFVGTPHKPSTRVIRTYLKSILSNPESRKIFYFLMLNMCYMLVQMLYGIWTNSLGLISDAIHMAFDCMAIGVGLIASVMARWPPNEKFTYGYGRIETLSGFANGIFLILISVFIVFEAIQRLLDPPEMNTSQLLLVSSLGLGVNLFGMFAMGGHHHGGHSHSHSHSHSHNHTPSSVAHTLTTPSSTHDHSHSHSHAHEDEHMHHSHAIPNPPPATTHELSHSHSHSPSHTHSHSQSQPRSHPDSHSSSHSHSHSMTPHHSHSHTAGSAICSDDQGCNDDLAQAKRGLHSRQTSLEVHVEVPGTHVEHRPSAISLPAHVAAESISSPITPNYQFGHDEHYETHHASAHTANLHDHSHVHDHAHEGHSDNMRGVFLHVMADTLGSVGVIVSTLLIQFYGWTGFDPIASLFIAVLIAASVIPLVIDTGKVLALDLSKREITIQEALLELPAIKGLESYTAPRFWPKDASSVIGTIHVQLSPSSSSFDPTGPHSTERRAFANVDTVVERVDKVLRKRIPGLDELTIQVEESNIFRE